MHVCATLALVMFSTASFKPMVLFQRIPVVFDFKFFLVSGCCFECLLLTVLATYRFVESYLSSMYLSVDVFCVSHDHYCVSEAVPALAEILLVLECTF